MKHFRFIFPIIAVFFLAACSSVSTPVNGVAKQGSVLVRDSAVVSGTLENGMSWLVLKNSEPANRICLRLVVKSGSILEDNDQKGIAHLIEHMAFNGTEHFKKNELVDYFESIGMTFGPEVNAYTAFDETVFMLEIPADDPAILARSLLVLHDWACSISFNPEELEKERGVVIEEWRLGRGASGRIQDKEFPFLFKGSHYAERLPIGDPEIVRTISADRIKDFYHKWYRPELMSVVLVGDSDPQVLAEAIKKALGTVPPSKETLSRPQYSIPLQKTPEVLVVRDPEVSYSQLQILEQVPSDDVKTVKDLRRRIAENLAISIFNKRLAEKTLASDPLLLDAEVGVQRIVKPTSFHYLAMVPANGRFPDAFSQLMEELVRYQSFGVTDAELDREKKSVLDSVEQAWLDRNKINSVNRAGSLVRSVLYGDPFLSMDNRHDLYNSIVPEISASEINGIIKNWFTGKGRGTMLLVTTSDKAKDVPDEATLFSLWQNWKPAMPLSVYSEKGLDRPLYEPLPVPSSSVTPKTDESIKQVSQLSASGVKEWILKNGARVVIFPTKFKANEILFSAFSKGGSSIVPDKDYPSAEIAASYEQLSGLNGFSAINLQKKLSGKTVSVGSWIDESREGLSGHSSVNDLETLFQLVNLYFTRPAFTGDAWKSLIAQLDTEVKTRKNAPEEVFSDMKVKLLYGDNPRRVNLSESVVKEMDPAKAESVYRERFADAGDFTFVFVGSFNEEQLKRFAETYLAVLPSSGSKEEARYVGTPFPKGVSGDTLKMGIDPQSSVFIAFGGKPEIGPREYELFDMLTELLDIRFREVIREEMSGSYGVQVSGALINYPLPAWQVNIEFGCQPGREESLTKAVLEQIDWLKKNPIPEVYITKLRENYRRSQESGLKNNGYWLSKITQKLIENRPLDEISDTDSLLSLITPERMQAMVKKYLPSENYVKAYLMPKEK